MIFFFVRLKSWNCLGKIEECGYCSNHVSISILEKQKRSNWWKPKRRLSKWKNIDFSFSEFSFSFSYSLLKRKQVRIFEDIGAGHHFSSIFFWSKNLASPWKLKWKFCYWKKFKVDGIFCNNMFQNIAHLLEKKKLPLFEGRRGFACRSLGQGQCNYNPNGRVCVARFS